MALREINSDAHADARVRTGRAAGPNRVRIFALWTGHGETAVPVYAFLLFWADLPKKHNDIKNHKGHPDLLPNALP